MSLLDWLGLLDKIGDLLGPLMQLWRVPGESAVILVSGWLVGIYGAVAAMAILPLSAGQITVLAVMTLTAHNLPVEATVQHRTGTPWWLMAIVRLVTGGVLGWIVAVATVREGAAPSLAQPSAAVQATLGFGPFLLGWLRSAGSLALKVFVILIGLMLATEWMAAHDVYRRLARPLRPLLRFMGLSGAVAFLWITAIVLGLAYGSGLLMEEAREGDRYRPQDLRDLNVSIGLFHSLFEDSALLAACGASLFWITVPRMLVAAIVVRIVRWIAPASSGPEAAVAAPRRTLG